LLIHNHKYLSDGSKDKVLILEQVKFDKDCETWE